jgi:predicted  nucleic acid-binding Zn-ribbon protein
MLMFIQPAEEELAGARETIAQQNADIKALQVDLDATSKAAMAKEAEVSDLQGKVVNVRSHALRLEEELRSLRSGEVSNVHRVSELQQELEEARAAAGALLCCLLPDTWLSQLNSRWHCVVT